MRWDTSDRERQTRRSDVAFWLHLLAAPMIAHPLFHWLGVTGGENIGVGAAVGVLLVYVALGIVALAIDRRALLVSALARSEERRVGKECVSTCRSRWSPYP